MVDPVLADDPFRCALLLLVLAEEGDRPLGFANKDFQPNGDFLCFKLLPLFARLSPFGSSMTVWYFGGREAGPPPTSI